jgi:CHAD domain-containing protein
MSYKIKQSRPLDGEMRRIVKERITNSMEHLSRYDQSPDKAVHEVRKNMKKIRGALRLIRYSIPDSAYKALNTRYRDFSRMLAAPREAAVYLETLDALRGDLTDPDDTEAVEKTLREDYRRTHRELLEPRNVPADVRNKLKQSIQEIDTLSIERQGFDIFYEGFMRIYKQGQKALKQAKAFHDGGQLHDWRKRVKYLWYHLRLLQGAWPNVVKGYAKSLDEISDCLGLEHDLVDLKNKLRNENQSAIQAADKALYRAKNRGKNCVVTYQPNEKKKN